MTDSAPPPTDVWALGDYAAVAARLRPAAHALVDAVGAAPGDRLLDVAAGQGNCALEAARRGAVVTAVDASPAMIAAGRRATPADAPVEWFEADARTLPVADSTFDAAVSCFGLIFVPEPEAAVAELARTLRPGGALAVAAWTHEGALSATSQVFGQHFGPPQHDMLQWAVPDRVHALLDDAFTDVALEGRTLPWPSESPSQAVEWLAQHAPPFIAGLAALGDAAPQARTEMVAVMARELGDTPPAQLTVPWLMITARRR